jgi:hypothetical protein
MNGLKRLLLTASAGMLLCVPMTPAVAAGPLLLAPFFFGGHALGDVARLLTLPLVASSAVASAPALGYPPPAANYYAPPNYYPQARVYYSAPRGYYAPTPSYAYRTPGYYGQPRGYYAPTTRYPGYHGAQASYRSRGYSYRRR